MSSNQIDVSDIEELAGDIEGIARILLEIGGHRTGCDHDRMCHFLGSRLFEYWRELDALVNPEEDDKPPVVVELLQRGDVERSYRQACEE